LDDVDFVNFVNEYDVLCFTETWQKTDDVLCIDGYTCIFVTGKKPVGKRGRNSGGVCIYCKNKVSEGVRIVEKDVNGVIWVKLDKLFFNTDADIFLCVIYILPPGSPILERDNLDFFYILETGIARYENYGNIIVCGDLNARVGDRDDVLQNNDLYSYVEVCDDDMCVEAESNIPDRVSEDRVVNTNGRRLLSLCKSTGLLIGNGRLGQDRGIGRFTCCTEKGRSCIDYVLLYPCCLDLVHDFKVLDLTEYSVHSPIVMCLKTARDHVTVKPHRVTREYISWDPNATDCFRNEITTVIGELRTLTDSLCVEEVSQQSVDVCVNSFSNLLYKKAFDVCGKSTCTVSGSGISKHNPWFDERCKEARTHFKRARNVFYRSSTDYNRTNFTKHRNIYNKVCRNAKIRFKVRKGKDLCNAVKTSPRSFWKTVKQFKKTKTNCTKLSNDDFLTHFKDLFSGVIDPGEHEDEHCGNPITADDDILDVNISHEEVITAIHKLKCNKSAGIDGLVGEVFKSAEDIIVPAVTDLFNVIYDSGIYPTAWSKGVVVPIPKKANTDDVNNFRGITLMSVFGKLFSIVLSNRLQKWADNNDKLSPFQFGFQPGKSTVDCIFILHSLIAKLISKGDKLYCAFVDFEKAFDKVHRHLLWHKLLSVGVGCKLVRMLKSLYKSVELCVKFNGETSTLFESLIGLKQGEPLSPILFLFFINDVLDDLKLNDSSVYSVDELQLLALLFADDTALFAKSPDELQSLLNQLHTYCIKSGISVNTKKTKVVIFEKGKSGHVYKWCYGDIQLEIVNTFVYLGVLLSNNGRWNCTQLRLHDLGSKALHSVFNIFEHVILPVEQQCYLFDTLVKPILNYGSEVWGFHSANELERLHMKFCKRILAVRKSATNAAIRSELGRIDLTTERKICIVRFWIRIISNRSTLLYKVYTLMRNDADNGCHYNKLNWAYNVKKLLTDCGMLNVWNDQDVNIPSFYFIKQRIVDISVQELKAVVTASEKLCTYAIFKQSFVMEPYLTCVQNTKHRKCLTRFRISAHDLAIERGRYQKIERHNRLCKCCNMNVIENEYHFLLVCPAYAEIRKSCLNQYYCHWPNIQKFVNLMSATISSQLRKLARYVYMSMGKREYLLEVHRLQT
jgi:exonuclease III